ncbi:MAG TPA: ABC transporter ATP-binding protein [Spirochaetia bacterium]|nr:ABC transporter ATP-binding protein [Spirochaetia bacterium]
MSETGVSPHVILQGITKSFGDFRALSGVSLEIPRGSFTTFLGPSGCGKTTLLRTIAGFYEPDSGQISINGRRVDGVPSHLRGAVMVFQDYALFPHLSAAENIVYGLKVKGLPRPERERRLKRIADYLSVTDLLSRRPGLLSGGQQQRVALARALVMEPEVLLLDEPLSNLDAKLRETVRAELRRLQQSLGITTIYVTHDQTEALSLSDQLVVMNAGTVVQAGPPRQVYFAPANRFVASFVGTANLLSARVTEVADGHLSCDAGGLSLRARRSSETVEVGCDVVLSVRPEHLSLLPQEGSAPAGERLPGVVISSLFEGPRVRYWIRAQDHELIVDDYRRDQAAPAGAAVFLGYFPEQVHVMEAEPNGGD